MDRKLLRTLQGMTTEQLYRALYCDGLTGLLNRKAFESIGHPAVAIIDLDSLKFINDTRGHREGDAALRAVADQLAIVADRHGFKAYRVSGDEFVLSSINAGGLRLALRALQDTYPRFSYGVGRNLIEADRGLRADKADREKSGARAERGERPPWLETTTGEPT